MDLFIRVGRLLPSSVKVQVIVSPVDSRLPKILQTDLNLCELLGKSRVRNAGFLSPWLRKILHKNVFPQGCPIREGNYSWRNLNLDDLTIPSFIPNSKYDVNALAYFGDKSFQTPVCNLSLQVKIE
ncbi:uncharacterized protein LOC131995817 [Stomoxys calcitrans]|uniref:uncharacterized protein LOC131995817 n=1 Tax=Stomoxys calcitrans TaxID=35570 RepID=UPI0027E3053C|nr:uncharacterized protein LOC131995817 [Stomoxys calcitrans]